MISVTRNISSRSSQDARKRNELELGTSPMEKEKKRGRKAQI
jgi:hypothetical protein